MCLSIEFKSTSMKNINHLKKKIMEINMVMIVSIRDLIDNNAPVGRKEMCFTLQPHLCISMFIELETSVSSVVLESQGQIASPSMSFRLAFFL